MRSISKVFFLTITLASLNITTLLATEKQDDFGGRWVTNSLNFKYGEIITGPTGNVISAQGIKYDIDHIHTELKDKMASVTNVAAGHNQIVASLSVIFKCGDGYEYSCQKFTSNKTIPVFVSGTAEVSRPPNGNFTFIGASDRFTPQDIFRDFIKRVSPMGENVPNIAHGRLREYCEEWKRGQVVAVGTAKQEITRSLSMDFPEVRSFKRDIDEKFKPPFILYDNNAGSTSDSEQYLIAYLKHSPNNNNPSFSQSNLMRHYEETVASYHSVKPLIIAEQLKNDIQRLKAESTEGKDSTYLNQQIDEAVQKSKDKIVSYVNSIKELGCILHFHSTNEICCCCAYSMVMELYNGIGEQLRQIMKAHNADPNIKPFVFMLYSASNKLPIGVERPGIGDHHCHTNFHDPEQKIAIVDELIEKGFFLQRLLPGDQPASATDEATTKTKRAKPPRAKK